MAEGDLSSVFPSILRACKKYYSVVENSYSVQIFIFHQTGGSRSLTLIKIGQFSWINCHCIELPIVVQY